jgi:hypothetical protein
MHDDYDSVWCDSCQTAIKRRRYSEHATRASHLASVAARLERNKAEAEARARATSTTRDDGVAVANARSELERNDAQALGEDFDFGVGGDDYGNDDDARGDAGGGDAPSNAPEKGSTS